MTFPNERDIRLHNFNKTFSKDLDETIVQQEKEIKQKYSQEFDHELTQAELCAKNGDTLGAIEHKLRAEMINDFLKSLA